ncbi:hypothetical protein [Streptomyces sp. NPDC001508]|uniref:hypothetical protein n=1 Tax=Streptomyces sp. NPDC001508 TaxID=3154656 RepID=UPI003324859B
MFIDDHVPPRRRIGRPPKPSDAELLCLAVTQALLGFNSDRLHPAAVRGLPRDGQTFRACRARRLRTLPQPLAFSWGFRLYLPTTAEGMSATWGLAGPKPGEREATTALPERDHHLIRAGQPLPADTIS